MVHFNSESGEERPLYLNNGYGEDESVPKYVSTLLPLAFVVVWLCALATLCIGLMYTGPIQAEIQRVVPQIPPSRRVIPTPTLDWPTPTPMNTPRPTPTTAPTPTPLLGLRVDEIDTVAALVAYEALNEPLRGQTAVAYTLLHRSMRQGKLPSEVLTKEFFGTEAGAEHLSNMKEWWRPDHNDIPLEKWQLITLIAIDTVNDWSYDEFPTSTHFYSRCVLGEPPSWTHSLELLDCIGCHCFYGPKGG